MLTFFEKQARVGKVYSATVDFTAISGTSEVPFLLFKNPSGSGKTAQIKYMKIGDNSEGYGAEFKLYSMPTITDNGTSVSIVNHLIGGSASSMEVYLSSTASANGTFIEPFFMPCADKPEEYARSYWVDEGGLVLLTVEPEISNLPCMAEFTWWEE